MADPLTLLLSPVLLAQGLWVRWRTPKLPEAPGPRQGHQGEGPPLSLLILGDSAAAGVGMAHQDNALCGYLRRRLADVHRLHWHLAARSGITTAEAAELLSPLAGQQFDVVLISLGVNDSLSLSVTPDHWEDRLAPLVDHIKLKLRARLVLITELPPMGKFERLPHPLRQRLGARARRFNLRLRHWAWQQDGVQLLDLSEPAEYHRAHTFSETEKAKLMASDGFHPGETVHQLWADLAAERIQNHLKG